MSIIRHIVFIAALTLPVSGQERVWQDVEGVDPIILDGGDWVELPAGFPEHVGKQGRCEEIAQTLSWRAFGFVEAVGWDSVTCLPFRWPLVSGEYVGGWLFIRQVHSLAYVDIANRALLKDVLDPISMHHLYQADEQMQILVLEGSVPKASSSEPETDSSGAEGGI